MQTHRQPTHTAPYRAHVGKPQPPAGTGITMYGPGGKLIPAIPSRPTYSSAHLGWRGFTLERHLVKPASIGLAPAPCHILGLALAPQPPMSTTWRIGKRIGRGHGIPGRAYLRAAGEDYACTTTADSSALLLAIEPQNIAWACDLLKVKGEQTLRSYLALDDGNAPNQQLAQIALRLDECVQGHSHNGSLYEETLLLALSLKLVMLYRADGRSHILPPRTGALLPGKLADVQEYIWANIGQSLSLDDIAQAVSMSTYHLCHQFRATLPVSLWQYVRACRAAYARRLMARHPGIPLSGVASASGFESYSAFYNAFHKTHGVTPSQFAPL